MDNGYTHTGWPRVFKSPLLVPSSDDNRRTGLLLTCRQRAMERGRASIVDEETSAETETVPL